MRAARFVMSGMLGLILVAELSPQVAAADGPVLTDISPLRVDRVDPIRLSMLGADSRSQSVFSMTEQAAYAATISSSAIKVIDPSNMTPISRVASDYFATRPTDQSLAKPDEARSIGDVLLAMLIGAGLVAYQLCRKHRMLRPHLFGT